MKKLKVKHGQVPAWANYAAKDKSNNICIYINKPVKQNFTWISSDKYQHEWDYTDKLKIKGPWKKSLRKIKVVEDKSRFILCPYCCKPISKDNYE